MGGVVSAANVSELEKFPDLADSIVRDWSMANRSKSTWRDVLWLLLGTKRAVSAIGSYELLVDLTLLSDVAYHHMRSES